MNELFGSPLKPEQLLIIATAWAYQQLSRFPTALNGKSGRAQTLIGLLQTKDLKAAAAQFYNSLEAPALDKFPIPAIYQEFLRAEGAVAALMSGSGSTTFAKLSPGSWRNKSETSSDAAGRL